MNRRFGIFLVAVALLGLALTRSVTAFNYVTDANGTWWGIQDAAPPRVDTGSIRATQIAPGQSAGVQHVDQRLRRHPGPRADDAGAALQRRGDARLRAALRRRRSLQDDAVGRPGWRHDLALRLHQPQRELGTLARHLHQHDEGAADDQGRVRRPVGHRRIRRRTRARSSTRPAAMPWSPPADSWVEVATPLDGNHLVGGPQVTVIGTPTHAGDPFAGAMTFAGNWLHDTFNNPLSYSGHEGNFQAYVNTLTLPPGKSRSLLHFVVLGPRVTAATSAGVRAAVEATASRLAAAPEIGGLTTAEICSIANFNIAAMTMQRLRLRRLQEAEDGCRSRRRRRRRRSSRRPPRSTTWSRRRSASCAPTWSAAVTTSQEITRAYLDRIEFYDKGQFGFHAYEIVATDAMAQAKAADAARKAGRKGPLLGIPIAVKNIYDTYDMATTNGSLTFEDSGRRVTRSRSPSCARRARC